MSYIAAVRHEPQFAAMTFGVLWMEAFVSGTQPMLRFGFQQFVRRQSRRSRFAGMRTASCMHIPLSADLTTAPGNRPSISE